MASSVYKAIWQDVARHFQPSLLQKLLQTGAGPNIMSSTSKKDSYFIL